MGKTRRRRRRKTRKQIKQLIRYHKKAQIAKGDKRFKAAKGLKRCVRISKGKRKRTKRIYHRRKCRRNERTL